MKRFFPVCSFLCLILLGAVIYWMPVELGDIWWHLKGGQYIVQNGFVPTVDPFAFGVEPTPWVYTQWLGGVIYFLIYDVAQLLGLQFFRMFFFLILVLLFWSAGRRRCPLTLLIILTACFMGALSNRTLLRPFVFNFLFIQIFLMGLFSLQKRFERKWIYGMLLSAVIWVNLHLGCFMYGNALIGSFLLYEVVHYLNQRLRPGDEKISAKGIANFSALLVLFNLIFLLTPYLLDGFLHAYRTILVEDYLSFGALTNMIEELRPPESLVALRFFWFFPVVLIGLTTVFSGAKKKFLYLILFAIGLFLFLYGKRANVFFVLVTAYSAFDLYNESLSESKLRQILDHVAFQSVLVILLVLSAGYFGINFLGNSSIIGGKVVPDYAVQVSHRVPREAVQLLEKQNFRGPVLNDDMYGGYLLWHGYPRVRPLVDSRQLDFRYYYIYHDIRRSPEKILPQYEESGVFKAALFNMTRMPNAGILKYLLKNDRWHIASVEGNTVLFIDDSLWKDFKADAPREISKDQWLPLLKQAQALGRQKTGNKTFALNQESLTGISLYECGFKNLGLQRVLKSYLSSGDADSLRVAEFMLKDLK